MPDKHQKIGPLGATNLLNWRLDSSSDGGRHVWHYIRDHSFNEPYEALWGPDLDNVKSKDQTEEARYWLGLELEPSKVDELENSNPMKAAQKGYEFYKRIQADDGHWSGELGGPMFMIPGLIITLYVTKTPIPQEWKIELSRYMANMQRDQPGNEGWGIHIESESTVFGTALNYVALRLLGVDAEVPMMIKARATLHKLGGATGVPAWGKFWLSVLNVYDWDGFNAIPAEFWLLPDWIPVHPSKWWVHTRNVFNPMSFISGQYFKAELDPLLLQLRQELYVQPYESINWPAQRNNICPVDLYNPHSTLLNCMFALIGVYDRYVPSFIREMGLKRSYELIIMEDENTGYQTVGPVSKALNMLARYLGEGPDSDGFKQHVLKVRDFLWMSDRGIMMCGTNGGQTWDTSFISQAMVDAGLANLPENAFSATRALQWFEYSQIRQDPKWYKEGYRHSTKGAWPFSTREQGYTVTDTTAESLKAVLMLQSVKGIPELISKERLCDTVDLILGLQNPDGGFASYELVRGPKFIEWLNPAEVFADIMIEHTYTECSTSCVTALAMFQKRYPEYRKEDIERAIKSTVNFVKSAQRPDGSWYGSWGVCFTYAGLFAIECLSLNKETYANSESVKRGCDFLISKQQPDGGWGETFKSCETHEYVQSEISQVVNTAYVVLALLHAKYPHPTPIIQGCRLIMGRQLKNGSWAREAIEGVFNQNCMVCYPNYKFAFTIWALGKAAKELGTDEWEA